MSILRFLFQTLCAFLQIKDRKHIKQNFYSVAGVMPQGWDLGVLGGSKKLAWGFAMAPHRLRILVLNLWFKRFSFSLYFSFRVLFYAPLTYWPRSSGCIILVILHECLCNFKIIKRAEEKRSNAGLVEHIIVFFSTCLNKFKNTGTRILDHT